MPNSNNISYKKTNSNNHKTVEVKPYTMPVTNNNGVMVSGGSPGFFQSIKDGFATSIGFNIADRVVSSIFGNRKVDVTHNYTSSNQLNCVDITKNYNTMLENGEVVSDSLKTQFNQCSKNN